MDRVFQVKLPMRIRTSAKKKQPINLNVYRNLHFRSLSSQKNKFKKLAKKLLQGIPPLGIITLHYAVCPQTKRRLDVMNVGSIVDKYFSDCLTEFGIIEDDDYVNIPQVTFVFGGLVDLEHVLVTITEIKPREEVTPMRVLLDENDIRTALTTYVSKMGIAGATGAKLEILNDEITAEVTFMPSTDPTPHTIPDEDDQLPPQSEEAPKPARRKRRTKAEMAADAAKAEEGTADVDETVQAGVADSSAGTSAGAEGEAAEAPSETETPATDEPKGIKKGNLFGDKGSPSSEDDGQAEAAPGGPPVPEEVAAPVKAARGSIFDA